MLNMFFAKTLALFGLLPSAVACSPAIEERQQTPCTEAYRLEELNDVAPAFSDQRVGAAAAFLQPLPLKPDATLSLYINGASGITVAPDDALVRDFALGVRQVFYYVYPTSKPASTDYGNGTTHTELEIVSSTVRYMAFHVED